MQSNKIRYLFVAKIFTSASGEPSIYASVGLDGLLLDKKQMEKIAKILFPEADLIEILLIEIKNTKKEAKVIHTVKFSACLI